ncbi:MAG: hypothetical protein JWQ97_3969 [Phenylobacterium sp.]|nr:hypothetical protein [Phenylobacterium sp.]
MGLPDQVMGSMAAGGRPQRKPGLGSTVAAGVILALLVKGVRSYQQSHNQAPGEGRSFNPQEQASQAQVAPAQTGGGLGGMLGGLLGGQGGGAGLGGLLSGLGGAGALSALVSQFQQKGLGTQVNSWVGPGHNEPVAPDQVAHALGEDNVRQLQEQTGLPRDSLLSELTQVLPQAVHELTPDGRLPDDTELHQIAGQAAAGRS